MSKKTDKDEAEFTLNRYRVVDLTRAQAGPVCTSLLAHLGMEVIKVESARQHDFMRIIPPYLPGERNRDSSGHYAVFNQGKKSVLLDISDPKGLSLIQDLIRISDVVVDNFAPGVMEKLGLSYTAVSAVKPDIIMASLTGYGSTGPYKDYVAFAKPVQAYSGLIELTGYADGPPGEPAIAMGDNFLGTYGAFAVLSALYHRSRTGEGQCIDVSMAESVVCSLPDAALEYAMNGELRNRKGNRDPLMAPHDVYRCKGEDEWVAIALSNDDEWDALCSVIDALDPTLCRFNDHEVVDRAIEAWTLGQTKHQAMKRLQAAGIPAAAVMNAGDLVEDPHLRARNYFLKSDHPTAPGHWFGRAGWKMSDTPVGIQRWHAPSEGEDNAYVYGELLGFSDREIAALIDEKVIY
ncbi:MAG: CoA transferase [Desulfobacterales bacterium]